MEEQFRCSICKEKLKLSEDTKSYQTLDEHVCDPNSIPISKHYFYCDNEKCEASKKEVFWDTGGDFYGNDYNDLNFINNLRSSFGSLSRQLEIEIYKKGLEKDKRLSPILCLWLYQPMIDYIYTADKDGNVLSKKWKIILLKRDKNIVSGSYCIHVVYFWKTYPYLWKKFRNNLKIKQYKEAFKKSFNRAFIYRSFEIFVKILFYKYYRKVEENKN